MARNKINAEMEARKGRRRVAELIACGMRNEMAVNLTAIEFCVEEGTVYKWRSEADDATLNEAIATKEAKAQRIWDTVHSMARIKNDGGRAAKTCKVAQDKPKENQRQGNETHKQGKFQF
jgi:hypothetical protein